MKYFKGSRRKVRKSSSLCASSSHSVELETEQIASTSQQTADSPKNDKTPEKRSRDSDKTEAEENAICRSRKRKAPDSENKSHHKANKSASQRRKNKSKQDGSSSIMETTDQSTCNNQFNQSDELSACESDGNFSLSNNRDSIVLHDADEEQSDRDFLQQQIKILKAPFELEVDCPALAKIRANDPKHIPLEVIHSALRKVNHKTEDEVMRSFNRTAQRKILDNLQHARPKQTDSESSILDEQQARYSEIQRRLADLEKLHSEIKQTHVEHKHLGFFVSQVEAVSEEFNSKKLTEEVKRKNTTNLGINTGLRLSDAPVTHQQLVEMLFKD